MSTTHQVVHTLRVQPRPELGSGLDGRLRDRIREATGLAVEAVRVHKLYEVVGAVAPGVARWVGEALLADPVAEAVEAGLPSAPSGGWSVQVGYRPGVTDNEGRTAEDLLACAARAGRVAVPGEVAIHASRLYELDGPLDEAAVRRIATEVLGNPLVQRFAVAAPGTALAPGWWREPVGAATPAEPVRTHVLPDDDAALAAFSREAVLALTAEELQAVRRHFARPEVLAARAAGGLPALPTDVELEAIAQTWSEHCKHKIFNDSIRLETPDGVRVLDAGLFKAHIRAATEQVATERDWLVSVFEDNAGVIRFVPGHHLVFKVETHNAPSALEPYGGALTGIVGVNRDPAATGLGARLIFNTDVFCFAPPDTPPPYPPGVLPPRRIFEGVRRGVEDGGNQSGVPTVNGALFFDPRFLGRPLVFCGTGALMDETVAGRPGHEKAIEPGDLVVMAGGRVGLDGIHGATFSSDAVGAEAPAGVVQIGDPITQKKLLDMLAEAREQGLFRAITDNGAGGLSSSVGELARLCGGASLALDRVPLKYPGLAPWQVLVSESQERMTLAVPPEHWPALQALAARRDVEVAAIGAF
ncbi:MAG: AIR synthase-related protein, partial [Candidatus Sericytochromatia bacterium]|nr:AIR synthase-related protein [Candidatus Sericytochromatia bacterium]